MLTDEHEAGGPICEMSRSAEETPCEGREETGRWSEREEGGEEGGRIEGKDGWAGSLLEAASLTWRGLQNKDSLNYSFRYFDPESKGKVKTSDFMAGLRGLPLLAACSSSPRIHTREMSKTS